MFFTMIAIVPYGFDSGFDTIGLAVSLLGQAYGSNFVIVITGPTNVTPLKLRLVSHFAPKYKTKKMTHLKTHNLDAPSQFYTCTNIVL